MNRDAMTLEKWLNATDVPFKLPLCFQLAPRTF